MRIFNYSYKPLVFIFSVILIAACEPEPKTEEPKKEGKTTIDDDKVTPQLHYTLVNVVPHDSSAFTEGLVFHEGNLYESTGAPNNMPNTRSTIGIVNTSTGKLDVKIEIDRKTYFGEGIQILNGKIYQLTYQNQTGFVYSLKNFKQIAQFSYPNKEGWGLTTDGSQLIMSDGSSTLTYIDPETYQITKKQVVTELGYEVFSLNELEYVDGFIYANIWMTNRIVKINEKSGEVVAAADLTHLYEQAAKRYPALNEMNGIAYEPKTKHFFVTGKMWATMFELQLSE